MAHRVLQEAIPTSEFQLVQKKRQNRFDKNKQLPPAAVSEAELPATRNARAVLPLPVPVPFRAADGALRAFERIESCSSSAAQSKEGALAGHGHLGSASQSSACLAGHGTAEREEDAVRGRHDGDVALHDLSVDVDSGRRAAEALFVEAGLLEGLAVHDAPQPLPLASVTLQTW